TAASVLSVTCAPRLPGTPVQPERECRVWIDRLMMSSRLSAALVAALLGGRPVGMQKRERAMPDVRLMTVDPGHFHAALVQKEMYPGVSERVDVYAPLGPALTEHVSRIVAFNTRTEQPTMWAMEVHASPDVFQRMPRERPGDVVVLPGRNRVQIARILESVQAGRHV